MNSGNSTLEGDTTNDLIFCPVWTIMNIEPYLIQNAGGFRTSFTKSAPRYRRTSALLNCVGLARHDNVIS